MITVREPAPQQMPQQSRLLDIDPMSQALYSNQIFSYDKSSINSGSELVYQAKGGNNRIKINISGQGVMNLAKSALVFRYKPDTTHGSSEGAQKTAMLAKAPIYCGDITNLFEVEQFQINSTSILTGSSKTYLFNQIMRVLQGKDAKRNGYLMGSDQTDFTISSNEMELSTVSATQGGLRLPPLQKKLYQKIQSGRLINSYRHYTWSGDGVATPITDENRSMSNLYMLELGDLIPQIASLGKLAEVFPLAFLNSVSITLRLIDPTVNHVFAGLAYGDVNATSTAETALDKGKLNYSVFDMSLYRVESLFNGDQAKAQYNQLLQENKIASSYTDFELMSFDVTSASQITATVPVALRDLRFVCLAFTLKDAFISTNKAGAYSIGDYNMFSTASHYAYNSPLHFYLPKIKDIFISINGQSRVPISTPQCLNQSDFAPSFLRGCLKQLIGNSNEYDQNYLDTLAGQSNLIIIPWQREAFANQAISLAEQSNLMQITVIFQDAQFQPDVASVFKIDNLQLNVFRCFDKQLQLSKMNALVY